MALASLQAWPLAVLIAPKLGVAAVQAVNRSLAAATFPPGSPLHVFSLLATEDYAAAAHLLGPPAADGAAAAATGAPPGATTAAGTSPMDRKRSSNGATLAQPLAPPAQFSTPAGAFPPGAAPSGPPASAPLQGVFVPNGGATAAWPAQLRMLAAHRGAADAAAVGALGDRLWEAPPRNVGDFPGSGRDRAAAHVCYMLAGRSWESAFSPASRFVLLGHDHEAPVASLAAAGAVQRSEALAWGLQQSTGAAMYAVAPHYLLVRPCPAHSSLESSSPLFCTCRSQFEGAPSPLPALLLALMALPTTMSPSLPNSLPLASFPCLSSLIGRAVCRLPE